MGQGQAEDWQPKGYQRLKAFHASDDLAVEMIMLAQKLPRGLGWLSEQIGDAAASVPANIVEGYSRASLRDYLRHLGIARASLAETEYFIHLLRRLNLVDDAKKAQLDLIKDTAGNLLYGLIRSLTRKLRAEGNDTTYRISEQPDFPYGEDEIHDP